MSLEYAYPGQWFDDMGSLVLSFPDAPALGVDIARAHLKRGEANNLAENLLKSGSSSYDQAEPTIGA
jgi:hypothetical protein